MCGKRKIHSRKTIMLIFLLFLLCHFLLTFFVHALIFRGYSRQSVELFNEQWEKIVIPSNHDDLNAYFHDSPNTETLFIISPGMNAAVDDYVQLGELLAENYDVLLYEGTGTNTSGLGKQIGFCQGMVDIEAVLKSCEDMGKDDILLLGHSKGAVASLYAASRHPSVHGVISVSGFESCMDALVGFSQQYVGKIARANYYPLYLLQRLLFDQDQVDFSSVIFLRETSIPCLVIQGGEDSYSAYMTEDSWISIGENNPQVTVRIVQEKGHTSVLMDNDRITQQTEVVLLQWLEEIQ